MKNTKRFMALLLTLVLVFGSMSSAFAAEVNEDVVGTEFEAVVGKLSAVGVMEGFPDGTFRPEEEITRAQFAAIAIRALGLGDAAEVSVANTVFSDVNFSHWAAGYINLAVDRGVIKGYPDGTFRPEAKLSNAEAITILVRLVGMGPVIDKQGTWPANYVSAANNEGILKGVNVASTTNSTRGIAAKMLANTLEVQKWGATGYDNDGSVTYGKLWDDELKLTLLNDNLEIVELEDVMFYGVDDDEVDLGGTDYDYVGVELDDEWLFLNTVDAWINADDEVVYVTKTSTQIFDAIEVNLDDDELTAIDADKDYDFFLDKDDDADVVVYINGDKEKLNDLADKYDYAKVVLDEKNDVIAINAYDWEDFLVVEDVDDTEVLAFGDDMDFEDYVVVKEGKAIELSDLDEGDILFYNTDAEYAEVYNNVAATGLVTDVFNSSFEVDGDEFDYDNASFDKGFAQYVDEDENIADFDSDAAEQMEDAEDEVSVFVDRHGNAVYVVGELGIVPTSTVVGVLYENAVGYKDVRDRELLEIKVVNEKDTKATYDFRISDLDTMTLNFDEKEIDTIATSVETGNFYDRITVTEEDNTTTNFDLSTVALKGDLVELTFDEDGDLIGLGFFTSVQKNDFDANDEVSAGDTYITSKRVGSSVPVFFTEGSWDDGDVEVELYGEIDEDIDLIEGTVYFDGRNAKYVVITDSTYDGTTSSYGVITDVSYEAGSSTVVTRFKALVDGEETSFRMDENAANAIITEGSAVEIKTYDANGKVASVNNTLATGWEGIDSVSASRDKEITVVSSGTYELVSDGYIYDVTKADDIETMTWNELRELENTANVEVNIFEDENGAGYAKFILVDTSGAPSTPGSVESDGTIRIAYDHGTDTTIRLTVDGNAVSYTVDPSNVVLLDADGNVLGNQVLSAGTAVDFVVIKGTDEIDVIQLAQ